MAAPVTTDNGASDDKTKPWRRVPGSNRPGRICSLLRDPCANAPPHGPSRHGLHGPGGHMVARGRLPPCRLHHFVPSPEPTPRRSPAMIDFAARREMMVDTQVRPSDVTKFPIIDAMLRVPRERFVPRPLRQTAYVGENLSLGGNRVILEPRTLAKMLDALDIDRDDLVLDIGCALGYSAAVIAH